MDDIVNLASLQKALEPLGWRQTADSVESPSGGVWLTAAELGPSGLCALYASMARRAETARRFRRDDSVGEYSALLRALMVDPQVQAMVDLHDAARHVFEPWAKRHGMALRFWDHSRAIIRAEARHPGGGVACVEWFSEEPKPPLLFLFHWIDNPSRSLRLSWSASVQARAVENDELLRQLDDAVDRLLEEREPSAYVQSMIAATEDMNNSEYERTLEVLR